MDNIILFQPLEQFEVVYLTTFYGYIINNSILYLILVYLLIRFFFGFVLFQLNTIPKNWQSFLELIYKFVFGLVKQQIGSKGYAYFPILFTLFIFILVANLIGMTLYSFTLTSHITIAFTLSFSFFIGIVIVGIINLKVKFLDLFVPHGAPKNLLPFIVAIEIVSYLSRPLSLGIRLFANMMSGHALLAILASFTLDISRKFFLVTIIPFILITAIVSLEVMIALLQAYVFTVLVCIYLHDALYGH